MLRIVPCWIFLCAAAPADKPRPVAKPLDVARDLRTAAFTDVYVNDSFEALDALNKAIVWARQKRWDEAAVAMQSIIDDSGEKLIRIGAGSYVNLRDHVNEKIARWPRPGIDAYRRHAEPRIKSSLVDSPVQRSIDVQLRLFERYFCTQRAAQLAGEIAELAIELGDLTLAQYVYRKTLSRHPDADAYRKSYGATLSLLDAVRGESSASAGDTDQAVMIHYKGTEVLLDKAVGDVEKSFAQFRVGSPANQWPDFGGDSGRNRRGVFTIDELGLLWQFEQFDATDSESNVSIDSSESRSRRNHGRRLTMYPVVGDELVYVQRPGGSGEILALRRNTGTLVWRYRDREKAATGSSFADEQATGWESPTLSGGRLYASFAGDASNYYSYNSDRSPASVVCLDARTGQLIWRFEHKRTPNDFTEFSLDSAPLVLNQDVLLIGRRRRSFGFEDCYLFKLDGATGEILFRTHLGSASTGSFGSQRSTRAVPALFGDTIYICTNLGTVAAVSAHTGLVRWLQLYQRSTDDGAIHGNRFDREQQPWQINPVIHTGHSVVVLPTDSDHILVFDEEDGTIEQMISLRESNPAVTLLGVHDHLVCTAGKQITCVDMLSGKAAWSRPLPEGESLLGRSVWVDGSLLVPTAATLSVYRVEDGQRTDFAWGAGREGGNLVALGDQLLVAGADRVSTYVRRSRIWETLRGRMAAAATDPLPAVELAEVALSNGEYAEALDALDEAVRRTDQGDKPPSLEMKTRLFEDTLGFAQRLSAKAKLSDEWLDHLFQLASRFPPDAQAHLRYRIHFARLFERHQRADRAIRLYHQILRDHLLRIMPHSAEGSASGTAGAFAEAKIAELIEGDRELLYASYEEEANRWLQRAIKQSDAAQLERIVSTFPNSRTAGHALVAGAELLAKNKEADRAARLFSRAYHRYEGSVDRPAILKKISDAYRAAGSNDIAYLWLTRALREFPTARIAHDGQSLSFSQYRDLLGDLGGQIEPSRPDIATGLSERIALPINESDQLLTPKFGDDPRSDWSRFYLLEADGVAAYTAPQAERKWVTTASGPVELLLATSDMAIFATAHEVFALDSRSGARRWSIATPTGEVDNPLVDWEALPPFRRHALHGARLLSQRDGGEVACIDLAAGRVLWSRTLRPVPLGAVQITDSTVVYQTMEDEQPLIVLIDAATGAWVASIPVDARRAILRLTVTLDGRVIVVTSRSVSAYDPDRYTKIWQIGFDGPLRATSLVMDVDAMYFSGDGRTVSKISISDGTQLWESERIFPRRDDDLMLTLEGGNLIATSFSAAGAIDPITGLTLWRNSEPDEPRFEKHIITPSYLVAVHIGRAKRNETSHAYFFDHRNGSGLVADEGGRVSLGQLGEVRAILGVDGALLIQTPQTLEVWRRP